MATDTVTLTSVVPASPAAVYGAWLDSKKHSAMIGRPTRVEARVGGRFSVRHGGVEGQIVDLQPGIRVVQSWRTREFPLGSPASRLELTLAAVEAGTRLTLVHTGIPEGQGAKYEASWEREYFAPMRDFFAAAAGKEARRAPATAVEPGGRAGKGGKKPVEAQARRAVKAASRKRKRKSTGKRAARPAAADRKPKRKTRPERKRSRS